MRNRKIVQTFFGSRTDHVMEIITDALASVTGGTMLGSSFGIVASILGGLVGSFFTSYARLHSRKI